MLSPDPIPLPENAKLMLAFAATAPDGASDLARVWLRLDHHQRQALLRIAHAIDTTPTGGGQQARAA
jgi:hypothetical protein